MVLFVLVTVGSLVVATLSVIAYGWQDSLFTLLGLLLYILGMFMVTGRGNVSLNELLRKTDSSAHDIDSIWSNYYRKWTRLNTLRCILGALGGIYWLVSGYIIQFSLV